MEHTSTRRPDELIVSGYQRTANQALPHHNGNLLVINSTPCSRFIVKFQKNCLKQTFKPFICTLWRLKKNPWKGCFGPLHLVLPFLCLEKKKNLYGSSLLVLRRGIKVQIKKGYNFTVTHDSVKSCTIVVVEAYSLEHTSMAWPSRIWNTGHIGFCNNHECVKVMETIYHWCDASGISHTRMLWSSSM